MDGWHDFGGLGRFSGLEGFFFVLILCTSLEFCLEYWCRNMQVAANRRL